MARPAKSSSLAAPPWSVVTGNKRLSRVLVEQHNQAQVERGLQAWPAPDILPWSAWLQRSYIELQSYQDAPLPRLLSDVQEQIIWETLVRSTAGPGSPRLILQPNAAAGLAAKAQTLLDRWSINAETLNTGGVQEVHLFKSWSRQFEQRCKDAGWIRSSQIESLLCHGFQQHHDLVPKKLILHGFQQRYPQQLQLLELLEQAGAQIEWVQAPVAQGQAQRLSFASAEEELVTVARWCREIIETHEPGSNGDPMPGTIAGTIGVVVPDLTHRVHQVEDIFHDVLEPNWWQAGEHQEQQYFNISLGATLLERPMLIDAVDILSLATGSVSPVQAGRILLSQYISGANTERDLRARIDVHLRELGETRWTVKGLTAVCLNPHITGGQGVEIFVQALNQLSVLLQGPKQRPASAWAECFSLYLQSLGWPAEDPLDSEQFQLVTAFTEQLAQLASLDGFSGKMSGAQALGQLQRMLSEQRFQPQGSSAPIQILGLLEATGLNFQKLWLTGMQDRLWPSYSNTNPFLPLYLQRQELMPGATPQTDLDRAQAFTQDLLCAAPEVWISHARMHGDQHCRVSALLEQVRVVDVDAIPLSTFNGPLESIMKSQFALEQVEDVGPPALAPETQARGGSAALQDQSACPFRAAAHFRLGAKGLEPIDSPINARVRGIMAHRLMQRTWERLKDSETLTATDPKDLELLLEDLAAQVVGEQSLDRPQAFSGHIAQLEASRLVQMAIGWLTVEAQRPSFQVIATEQRQLLKLGSIHLDMRLDRIDQLHDGGMFLIDYKTGEVSTRHWMKPRPSEPQLPLYCLLLEPPQSSTAPLAGLAFAGLKRGASGFAGFAEVADTAPGLKTFSDRTLKDYANLTELVAAWRLNLEVLAGEFSSGEARVEPRDGRQTCRYCDAKSFCRVSDLLQAENESDSQ